MRETSKIIKVPLYNSYFNIIVTDDIEYLLDNKFIKEFFEKDDEIYAEAIRSYTYISDAQDTETSNVSRKKCMYVIFNPNFRTKLTNGVVAHEALHLVNFIMNEVGIDADRNNDEADAYLLDWFITEIYKYLKELKIKLI